MGDVVESTLIVEVFVVVLVGVAIEIVEDVVVKSGVVVGDVVEGALIVELLVVILKGKVIVILILI